MSLTGLSLWSNKDSLNKRAFVYLKDILVIFFSPFLVFRHSITLVLDATSGVWPQHSFFCLQQTHHLAAGLWISASSLVLQGEGIYWQKQWCNNATGFFPFLYLFYFIFACPVLFIYLFKCEGFFSLWDATSHFCFIFFIFLLLIAVVVVAAVTKHRNKSHQKLKKSMELCSW